MRVVLHFVAMLALMIAILFLPAGTLRWAQAWAFLAVLATTALAIFLWFLKTDPQVVERRLRAREQVRQQKLIMTVGYLMFSGLFTLPGFDFRFGWSQRFLGAEPVALQAFSLAIVFVSMLAVGWVIWTNRYAGRTIRVESGQQVISSGPYRLVRHPMYAFSFILWAFTPLAMGSYVALPAFALSFPFYVLRILNEEKVLRAELSGYSAYCETTRWRMVPFVW
jgi:protein-S-isoprenylcysteine O-methyltransferase Ste14